MAFLQQVPANISELPDGGVLRVAIDRALALLLHAHHLEPDHAGRGQQPVQDAPQGCAVLWVRVRAGRVYIFHHVQQRCNIHRDAEHIHSIWHCSLQADCAIAGLGMVLS